MAAVEVGVIAEGKVVPAAFAELHFVAGGSVAELLVREGDLVAAGAPLARLDSRELELRLAQAEAAYSQAQASYEDLRAGATPEQIAAAEARAAQAQASLTQAQGSVTAADIAAARAQLEQARARLAQLRAGPKDSAVAQAQAALDQARADLQARSESLSLAKTSAERAIGQAANALRDAQDGYSRLYWDNRKLEGLPGDLPQERIDAEASALRAVQDAEIGLVQARAAYDQAVAAERDGIAAAEARADQAAAGLSQASAGADADQIAAAQAQLAQARADLDKLLGDSRQGSLDAAQAVADAARADLDALSAGPTDSALAVAQARAQTAADRDLAQLHLEQATLSAPFAGTVAQLNLKLGEATLGDRPALILADLSSWQIEAADLTELSVVKLRVGEPAAIGFDALGDLELPGLVSQIRPVGANRQGDIVYTVVVTPSSWDERLQWNMTASVTIGG